MYFNLILIYFLWTGFLSGQDFKFNATIDNKSTYVMNKVIFSIEQKIFCVANNGKKNSIERVVNEITFPKKVEKRICEEWSNVTVTIPPICPSSNNKSKIANISYLAKLVVVPNGAYSSFGVEIPIVIGTVPFAEDNQNPKNEF